MEILKRILDFLTANPFDEEEAKNRELHRELKREIKRIKRNNKQLIIETQIKPFIIADYLKRNNLLPTAEELESIAEWEFSNAKKLGLIDDLNALRIF